MASVVTIGTFDGVHRGHAALLARARSVADDDGRDARPTRPAVTALVFDPHPMTVLRSDAAPARLTTWEHRAELLRRAGADRIVRLEPRPQLLGMTAEAFVERLVAEHAPVAIVEGEDFRFGKGRAGDVELLRRAGTRHAFTVEVVEPVTAALADHTEVVASSSIVRWLVENGRVRDAAAALGRPYSVVGRVVRGDRAGRVLGYPTANVLTECLAPGDGVYAGRARLPDGREYAAAISVGTKPQFGGAGRWVEAHLLGGLAGGRLTPWPNGTRSPDWKPLPGLPEYGWGIEVEFTAWLRDQARFDSVEALVAQIGRDCARAADTAVAPAADARREVAA